MGISLDLSKVHIPQAALSFVAFGFAIASQMPQWSRYQALFVMLATVLGGGAVGSASATRPMVKATLPSEEVTQPEAR